MQQRQRSAARSQIGPTSLDGLRAKKAKISEVRGKDRVNRHVCPDPIRRSGGCVTPAYQVLAAETLKPVSAIASHHRARPGSAAVIKRANSH